MMYSAYKLTKQGDNIQPWCTPFPIWNQSVVPTDLGEELSNLGKGFISGMAEFGGGSGRLCVRMGALLVLERNQRSGKDCRLYSGR